MRSHIFLISLLSLVTVGVAVNLVFTISNFNEQKNVQSALSDVSSLKSLVLTSGTSETSTSSPIPDDFMFFCPPSEESVQSAVRNYNQELYVELYLGCGDSNFIGSNHLFLKLVDGRFVPALEYSFSNHSLTWRFENGEEQKLMPIADIPWSEIDGFGGDGNPVEVYDVTLNGEELNLLRDTISYRDGGLGGFQGAEFELIDVTKGLLKWNEVTYEVNFEDNTVSRTP